MIELKRSLFPIISRIEGCLIGKIMSKTAFVQKVHSSYFFEFQFAPEEISKYGINVALMSNDGVLHKYNSENE